MYILKYFVLIISCVVFHDAFKFRCDYTYTGLGGWFKYHVIPATWQDAYLRCKFEGGMLASPTTPEIKQTMLQFMGKLDIFTGIHATVSRGNYYTIDGIPLNQIDHKWTLNEPDNKNNEERCLTLNSDGGLSDVKCETPYPYICHRLFSNVDVSVCGTIDQEYQFDLRMNKCYKFHTTPRTFSRAHFVCAAEGGHLVIINSEQESTVIREIFARYPPAKMIGSFWKDVAFVGFHNWGESADWTTLDGQSLEDAGFAKFSEREPNNATNGEYCGAVYRNGLFDDLWCENHYAFICEKKPDYPPVCISTVNESQSKLVIN